MSTRREFVLGTGGLVAAHGAMRSNTLSGWGDEPRDGITLLFQGDSITDDHRNRTVTAANDEAALGEGYPLQVMRSLRTLKPFLKISIFNRGVSGNLVADLGARWQADTLDLKPTLLSILIGVNDVWHNVGKAPADTVVKSYESQYSVLLDATKAELPGVRLIILEPFVLRTGAVSEAWFPEFDQLRAAAKRVSDRAVAQFVPLHDMFQERAARSKPEDWISDGVHPTPAGHAAIAKQWLEVVKL